jgi:ERCC4-related helicase
MMLFDKSLIGTWAVKDAQSDFTSITMRMREAIPQTPTLAMEEYSFADYASFAQVFGIETSCDASFEFKANQGAVAAAFLHDTVDGIIIGKTGSGKTAVAWLIAMAEAAKGKRVIFTAPTHDLVRQFSKTLPHLLGVSPDSYAVIEQGATDRQRLSLLHDPAVQFLMMTPQQADILMRSASTQQLLFPQGEGLIIADEFHKIIGNAAGVKALQLRPEGVRVVGLTATLKEAIGEVRASDRRLQAARVFQLSSESAPKIIESREVQLDSTLQAMQRVLKEFLQQQTDNMLRLVPAGPFHNQLREALDDTIPAVGVLQELAVQMAREQRLQKFSFDAQMSMHKYRQLFQYYQSLTLFGRAELLHSLIESIQDAKKNQKKRQDERIREGKKPSQVRSATTKLMREPLGQTLFALAVDGTPMKGLLPSAPVFPKTQELIEMFAHMPQDLHPKQSVLMKIIQDLTRASLDRGVLIYCERTFTARLLAATLTHRFAYESLRADYLIGTPATKADRMQREHALLGFRGVEEHHGVTVPRVHILVGTTTLVHGVDTDADCMIAYNSPASSTNFEQLIGRVGRRERIGTIYFLVTAGSADAIRFLAGSRRVASQERKAARS